VNWSYPTPAGFKLQHLLGETGDATDVVYIWIPNGIQALRCRHRFTDMVCCIILDGLLSQSSRLSPDGNQLYARAEGREHLQHSMQVQAFFFGSFNTGSGWRLNPVIGSNGTVYEPCASLGGSNHDFVVALNPSDGSLIWSYDIGFDGAWWPGGICLTPDETQVIIAARGGAGLRAVSTATGTLNWQFWEGGAEPAVGDFFSPPVVGAQGNYIWY